MHSFSSLSQDRGFDSSIKFIRRSPFRRKKYLETDVIILDEVSMVDPDFFDLFDAVCRKLRKCDDPFGGIQMVLCGDFFQLPPVNRARNKWLPSNDNWALSDELRQKVQKNPHLLYSGRVDNSTRYVFESMAWNRLMRSGMHSFNLNKPFRQQNTEFVSVLDNLREGFYSGKMWDYIEPLRYKHKSWNDKIRPTLLSAYRKTADMCNMMELERLSGTLAAFQSIDHVTVPSPDWWGNIPVDVDNVNRDFDTFQAENCLNLKVGAQVILIRNLSLKRKLVNGSRGVVVGFRWTYDPILERPIDLPIVEFGCGGAYVIGYHPFSLSYSISDEPNFELVRKQIPLKLGWGLTIHKSQGMTLDKVILDLPRAFAPGHAYVAMSRARDPSGLSIANFGDDSLLVSGKVRDFYHEMAEKSRRKSTCLI